MLTEGVGIPLAVSLVGGNRNDSSELLPLIEKIPPVRGRRGRPRQSPEQLFGDRAYGHDKFRKALRGRGVRLRNARRGQPHRSGPGRVHVGGRAHDRATPLSRSGAAVPTRPHRLPRRARRALDPDRQGQPAQVAYPVCPGKRSGMRPATPTADTAVARSAA